jgi:hypothetical protein
MILLFHPFYGIGLAFIIEDMRNRRNIGIIGDESNLDVMYALFLFQSSSQVIPPLLNDDIIP